MEKEKNIYMGRGTKHQGNMDFIYLVKKIRPDFQAENIKLIKKNIVSSVREILNDNGYLFVDVNGIPIYDEDKIFNKVEQALREKKGEIKNPANNQELVDKMLGQYNEVFKSKEIILAEKKGQVRHNKKRKAPLPENKTWATKIASPANYTEKDFEESLQNEPSLFQESGYKQKMKKLAESRGDTAATSEQKKEALPADKRWAIRVASPVNYTERDFEKSLQNEPPFCKDRGYTVMPNKSRM